ncbi:MAG: tRNA (adenosine(37)-N6)-dimethylallyltransferase MiaA [Bacteroidales bacterium]|nr:tRNA (adenosine(37)-N6)-dimethylallyltransferase MiaA [Bacteroidales bacterium]
MENKNLIVVLGPTASGKTPFAARLALQTDAEIISADSRQVYRGMTLGTGKDLDDYTIDGQQVAYHLIDIADAGEKYNVYRFQNDFVDAFNDIRARGKMPIMCGGTGLYIEAVLKGYKMISVPPNHDLRRRLEGKTLDELTQILSTYRRLHNTTDSDTIPRAVRAIEIEDYYASNPEIEQNLPELHPVVIGLDIDRDLRREKITRRLHARLDAGMVDEVRALLDSGLSPDTLIYYGLEYKYLTLYLIGQLSYDAMVEQLNIAIHQFAKRQMTWFRGMEKRGTHINWIDAALPMEEKIEQALKIINHL